MSIRFLLLLWACCSAFAGGAWAECRLDLSPTQSEISFRVAGPAGLSFSGELTEFSASLDFFPEEPERSQVRGKANILSLRIDGLDGKRKFLLLAALAALGNPEVHFKSIALHKVQDGVYRVRGELRKSGVRFPASVRVTLQNPSCKKVQATGEYRQSAMELPGLAAAAEVSSTFSLVFAGT